MNFAPGTLVTPESWDVYLTQFPGDNDDQNPITILVERTQLVIVVAVLLSNCGRYDDVCVLTSAGEVGWQYTHNFKKST